MVKLFTVVLLLAGIVSIPIKVFIEPHNKKDQVIQNQTISLPYNADASIYYLDSTNPEAKDDVEHGSLEKPWKTMSYALKQLGPGDTLQIRGGIYTNNAVTLTDQNSGQENAPITVVAYPGESVVVSNSKPIRFHGASWWILDGLIFEQSATMQLGLHVNLGTVRTAAAEHIIIRNCRFANGVESAISINYAIDVLIGNNHFQNIRPGVPFSVRGRENNAVVIRYIGDNIVIKGNRFEDIGSDGVHLGSQSYLPGADIGSVEISNNEFLVNRPYIGILGNVGENGIDVKKSRGPVLILGNVFHGFRPTTPEQDASGANGDGLIIHNEARNIVVSGNFFFDNTSHLNIAKGVGLGSADILIYNNIFRDSQSSDNSGYTIEGSALQIRFAENIKIYHNTFFQNPRYLVGNQLSACVFKNNIIIGGRSGVNNPSFGCESDYNAWSQMIDQVPIVLQGEHDVYAEDLGLDQDLRPSPFSPVVGAGQNVGITTDLTGRSRADPPDLGALEHISN